MVIALSLEDLPDKKVKMLKKLKENTDFIHDCDMLIDSTDNGKKYIIVYLESPESEKNFFRISYKYYNKFKTKSSSRIEKNEIIFDSINELRNKLLQNSVLREALNCSNILIIHGFFGWQQVFDSYIYRKRSSFEDAVHGDKFDNGYHYFDFKKSIDRSKLPNYYNEFITQINLLPHNFTLPLLAYCIFSCVKSLYKQYRRKSDILKIDRHFALNILGTENKSTNDYIIEYVKGMTNCYTNESKLIKYEINNLTLLTMDKSIKIGKSISKDFSVFSYNLGESNSKIKTKISSSVFHENVTSNVSHIYYNINGFEDYLLNLSIADDFKISSKEIDINSKSFNCLLDKYLDYISNKLSHETYEKEKARKEKLIKKIYDKNHNGRIYQYIYNFIDDICSILHSKEIYKSKTFFLIFFSETEKFTMKEFEVLEKEYRYGNRRNPCNFAKKYYDKHLLKYEHQFANKNNHANPESDIDWIADNMAERYIEMLVNSCISISKHYPTYFDNLHKKAEKYLKDNLKREKYDHVQLSRCSFLLASMISFRDYINNCLSEASEDFNKYFKVFNNIILQMCCTPLYKKIDNSTVLSKFSAFIKAQIDNNAIIDAELGTDSEIGWIDRQKNKIYLKNTSGNNFYNDFQKYLIEHNERIEISKQAFVRDILDANCIINARYAGDGKRYDYERKIGDKKYRVLVLDCERLNIQ